MYFKLTRFQDSSTKSLIVYETGRSRMDEWMERQTENKRLLNFFNVGVVQKTTKLFPEKISSTILKRKIPLTRIQNVSRFIIISLS